MDGAENFQSENNEQQAQEQTSEQLQFQQEMEYALNTEPPVQQAPQEADIANTQAPAATQQAIDYSSFLKENFGVENVEEAKTQWHELQALKANPQAAPEIKFEDEFNEKLFKAIQGGNKKEVYEYLGQQQKIEELTTAEVTDDTADEIIKLGMKFEYKGLSQKEIDYKFKKQFAIPKEPALDVDDEESVTAHNEWKDQVEDIKMSKMIEAKMMKPKLEAAKSQIKLPEIQQGTVDTEYESYKASRAAVSNEVENVLIPAIKAVKESDVPLGFKVSDASNNMDFDVALVPTAEDIEKAKQDSLDFDGFIKRLSYDKDGNFSPKNVAKLVLLYNNFDNYAQSIARQAVNAERKAIITRETASNNNGGRDFSTNIEKSELQKEMDYRLS